MLNVTTPAEIEAAFATTLPEKVDVLVAGGDSFFHAHHDQLIALAGRHRIPTIYQSRLHVAAAGSLATDRMPPSLTVLSAPIRAVSLTAKARRPAGAACN